MKPKQKRLLFTLCLFVSLSAGVFILLTAFKNNIVFFVTPTEALQNKNHTVIRVGGVVRPKSLYKEGTAYHFDLIDKESHVPVLYRGLLPDLFKEGATAVVQGNLTNGTLVATEVLAKHDENYQPLEIKEKLGQ
jgi:cytochrome c-type biogenesis protein CcmE